MPPRTMQHQDYRTAPANPPNHHYIIPPVPDSPTTSLNSLTTCPVLQINSASAHRFFQPPTMDEKSSAQACFSIPMKNTPRKMWLPCAGLYAGRRIQPPPDKTFNPVLLYPSSPCYYLCISNVRCSFSQTFHLAFRLPDIKVLQAKK